MKPSEIDAAFAAMKRAYYDYLARVELQRRQGLKVLTPQQYIAAVFLRDVAVDQGKLFDAHALDTDVLSMQ